MDYKQGDVVQLKSGGPEMTIRRIVDFSNPMDEALKEIGIKKGDLLCTWFVNGVRQEDFFSPIEIEKFDD